MTDIETNSSNQNDQKDDEIIVPKSPLQFSWTFWYLKPDKKQSWEKQLNKLIDLNFVEDFWATYNNLAVPSCLASNRTNCDYYFFKTGVRPMWEDPQNAKGGRWLLLGDYLYNNLDNLWQETLLGMIGDWFSSDSDSQPLSSYITGCVVSIRARGHKISLWLSESRDSNVVTEIGRRWKSIMNLPGNLNIQFELHNENGAGPQKPLYEV